MMLTTITQPFPSLISSIVSQASIELEIQPCVECSAYSHSLLGLEGCPSAYGLEKYGRPLLSMEQEGEKSRESERPYSVGTSSLLLLYRNRPCRWSRQHWPSGMRYMGHLQIDLYKQYLTFYTIRISFLIARPGGLSSASGI